MMWYIINRDGIVMASSDGKPNFDDLAQRGEQAIESDLSLPINQVELVNTVG